MSHVLRDPGWISFLEHKHALRHIRLIAGDEHEGAAFASVSVFVNQRGKLRTPRLMPYMPVEFRPTPTPSVTKLQRQWLTLGKDLAQQMVDIGFGGAIALDPIVADARPWQWSGLTAQVRYTYRFSLPKDLSSVSSAVRRSIKKAEQKGYSVQLTNDVNAVFQCLRATEERQSFGYGLTTEDLVYLQSAMEPGTFRMYLALAPDGSHAAARIVLAPKGGVAVDLVSGTIRDHLTNGVTQLAIAYSLTDLHEYGSASFDFEGANIDSVAASKMEWGCELVPFYLLSAFGPRSIALQGKQWISRTIREFRK